MELLRPTSQTVQNAVREVGINANYWYPVGWANQPSLVTSYRDHLATDDRCLPRHQWSDALENVCPQRSRTAQGKVRCHLACGYCIGNLTVKVIALAFLSS